MYHNLCRLFKNNILFNYNFFKRTVFESYKTKFLRIDDNLFSHIIILFQSSISWNTSVFYALHTDEDHSGLMFPPHSVIREGIFPPNESFPYILPFNPAEFDSVVAGRRLQFQSPFWLAVFYAEKKKLVCITGFLRR